MLTLRNLLQSDLMHDIHLSAVIADITTRNLGVALCPYGPTDACKNSLSDKVKDCKELIQDVLSFTRTPILVNRNYDMHSFKSIFG